MDVTRQCRPLNRGGEVMLGNWLEERRTKCYEPEGITDPGTNVAKKLMNGNKGIITTKFDAKSKKTTTQMAAYSRPKYPPIRTKGVRSQFIEETFSSRFRNYLRTRKAESPEEEPIDYNSIYVKSFNKPEFVPTFPEPTRPHDVNTEVSVSYWSENAEKVHGVSQMNRKDDSFKKNSHFTMPVEDRYDDGLHNAPNNTLDVKS